MNERVKPIADVSPIWKRDTSVYPDTVRIGMEDGRVVDYVIDINQPHPAFLEAMNTLQKWNEQDHGYQYQPKHKKPTIWERIQKARRK